MSVHLQSLVWQTVDVHGAEMLLLIAYADIGDDEGNSIYASDEHMSWKTGIPLRTIQLIKRKWRENGVLIPVGLLNLATKERVLKEGNVVSGGTGGRGCAFDASALAKAAIIHNQKALLRGLLLIQVLRDVLSSCRNSYICIPSVDRLPQR